MELNQEDEKYKKIFSKNLIYYMRLKGKTQSDIINDLDINKSAISSWCNGTRLPRMNKVELLAKYLNINVSDLIEKRNDSESFEYISEDDAMYPLLDVGDIAIVQKQENIESGATHLIKMDNKTTIRKITLNEDKSSYMLLAMNGYFRPIIIPVSEIYEKIKVLGKVIRVENSSAFK